MRLAVYPGTFNPFHKGHLNILQKAQASFDVVYVLQARNPDKSTEWPPLPVIPGHKYVYRHEGLITDFVKKVKIEVPEFDSVTIVRGLRRSKDLEPEIDNLRVMQRLLPEVQLVFIPCDDEFEFLSSSMIRGLAQFSPTQAEQFLVK